MRTQILFQPKDVQVHLLSDVRIEFSDLPFGRGSDLNAARQGLVPQLPHKVAERDSPLLFRFF
jgi:hypothetical protein